MYQTNAGMNATHPNSSKWYTWPIMKRSVFYWQGNSGDGTETNAYIYLLGNPFIYWLGSLTMIFTILYIIIKLILHKAISRDPNTSKLLLFIIVGFLANWLPFALIGRVMFLYHYEVALIFSIIAITYWVGALQPKNKKIVSIFLVFVTLISFIYWSPLTYGLPLDNDQLKQRMWLPGWR
jgi:dolichyl-phosphate-mannose-protein mannosyltransferase